MKEQIYVIRVKGEYITTDKAQPKALYEATFELDVCDGEALSVIQNKLIEPYLKEKFANFKRLRTCGIESQTLKGGKGKPEKADLAPVETAPQEFGKADEAPVKTPAKGKGKGKGKAGAAEFGKA